MERREASDRRARAHREEQQRSIVDRCLVVNRDLLRPHQSDGHGKRQRATRRGRQHAAYPFHLQAPLARQEAGPPQPQRRRAHRALAAQGHQQASPQHGSHQRQQQDRPHRLQEEQEEPQATLNRHRISLIRLFTHTHTHSQS